jgi:hypothetical protein
MPAISPDESLFPILWCGFIMLASRRPATVNGPVLAFRGDPLSFVDLLPWLCVTVFAIGGLVAAMFFLRFLRGWQLERPDDEGSLLAQFRELHRNGEISAEEYREVRISLAEQMRPHGEEPPDESK